MTSTDPFTSPAINPDYFGVGYDIDIMNAGSEFARKLAATAPLSDLLITETSPGAAMTDYDALANFTKRAAGTEYHPLGPVRCCRAPRVASSTPTSSSTARPTFASSTRPSCLSTCRHTSWHRLTASQKREPISSRQSTCTSHRPAPTPRPRAPVAPRASRPARPAPASLMTRRHRREQPRRRVIRQPALVGAKIGVGVGVALGALALIGALVSHLFQYLKHLLILQIVFFCLRRRKNKSTGAGVAATGGQGGRYNDDPAFASGNVVALAARPAGTATTSACLLRDLAAPTVPYAGAGAAAAAAAGSHQRKASHAPSLDSVATAEMASRIALTNRDSGYGLAAGLGDDSRPATPGEL